MDTIIVALYALFTWLVFHSPVRGASVRYVRRHWPAWRDYAQHWRTRHQDTAQLRVVQWVREREFAREGLPGEAVSRAQLQRQARRQRRRVGEHRPAKVRARVALQGRLGQYGIAAGGVRTGIHRLRATNRLQVPEELCW